MAGSRFLRSESRWATRAAALFVALAVASIAFGGIPQSSKAKRPAKPKTAPAPKPPAPDPPAPVPFAMGEKLAFRVLWSKYSVVAGNVAMSVVEHRDFFGHPAWHFQAIAHSQDTIRIIYALDDQFDSYTDAVRLASLQYEMYLHEQGKQQTNVWRMSSGDDPPPAGSGVAIAKVLPGTRDPIGALYALRAADWKANPEIRASIFDGRDLYEVDAKADPASVSTTVPAGQFTTTKIDVAVSQHGQELKDFHFSLWLGQDAARTPVLIEAEIPFGSARVELTGH